MLNPVKSLLIYRVIKFSFIYNREIITEITDLEFKFRDKTLMPEPHLYIKTCDILKTSTHLKDQNFVQLSTIQTFFCCAAANMLITMRNGGAASGGLRTWKACAAG